LFTAKRLNISEGNFAFFLLKQGNTHFGIIFLSKHCVSSFVLVLTVGLDLIDKYSILKQIHEVGGEM